MSLKASDQIIPLSKNDIKYISDKIGIKRLSIFLHNFRSCSGVRSGGGGNVKSPPKSTGAEMVSTTMSSSFSLDMESVGSWRGKGHQVIISTVRLYWSACYERL
jgi:hypothetical protein